MGATRPEFLQPHGQSNVCPLAPAGPQGWLCPPEVGLWLGAALWPAVAPSALPPVPQGPLEIGPGCLISGLTSGCSAALQGCPLRDVVLQGHHVRLHALPCRVYTLTGRLDDWQVWGGDGRVARG